MAYTGRDVENTWGAAQDPLPEASGSMLVFDGRKFRGGLPVDENAQRLSNCFHAENQLLHTLAGALPRVPDFHLKIVLGTHLWRIAQNLNEYSSRLSELRERGDYPARPGDRFENFLNEIDQVPSVHEQLVWIYQHFVPALCRIYDSYIVECDPLVDEPTVVVLRAARNAHEECCLEVVSRLENTEQMGNCVQHLGLIMESLAPIDHMPLRRGQVRKWTPSRQLEHFARPSHFQQGTDHGIDRRVIYGRSDEFYFPLKIEFRRHFLHHMVDAEMVAAELMACNIHEFPAMPLAFHIDMARQVWDEVRHARIQWEMLKDLNVPLGSFPVYHGYDLALYRRSLLDRLILFNRLGEAGAAQRHRRRSRLLRQHGFQRWAVLFDYLHADEVPHVMNGDRWARHLFTGPATQFSLYCQRVEREFQAHFQP